ncbi:aldolase [Jeotgalibacillus proteolyticus]|uniref:Aldolase n=2 Tax=Jeotgalibacillus proteolyticus TaxID=2082395 RepID=A0A2S5G909_9BACL|nr:aldolase [Jeotgalibacillus proteolyticus]PPA69468.1 aldolase [Jeotgalibacillus proteolyticus]
MGNLYQAFGLSILSEYVLKELTPLPQSEGQSADVVIETGNLEEEWAQSAEPNRYFFIKEKCCLFEIPKVAIYKIEGGNRITVSPYEGAKEDQLRLYLLGTCMGAILMQRKVLPLHGSAIAINGKAYAIVGDSGAGKSTLASAFLKRGYQLLSDDVIPVTLTEDFVPMVTPAYPQQKLWLESLNQFGMESANLRPIIDRETKFAVPVAAQFANQPMPLAGIVELVKIEGDQVEIKEIQKLERFHKLFYHTYRNFIITRSGLTDWHFAISAKMANKMDFYQVGRPVTQFTAHQLTDMILEKFLKEEKAV